MVYSNRGHADVYGAPHDLDDVCGDRYPDQKTPGINESQFGLLIAMPVLTGSLIHLPLGMLTDKLGGRLVLLSVMVSAIISNLSYLTRHRVLALPRRWPVRRRGRWLGGFLLLVMFDALVGLTGIRSTSVMLMFGIVWVSLMVPGRCACARQAAGKQKKVADSLE